MSMVFEDRVSRHPNTYTMRDENGNVSTVLLERADDPIVPGTPLNAETFNGFAAEIAAELANKAPAGFGLGTVNPPAISDLNTCKQSGWYYTNERTLNVPEKFGYIFRYASVQVYARTSEEIVQRLISAGHVYHSEMLRYTLDGGETWTEEFVTPPLDVVGMEYRTTERFKGSPVYAKLLDFGSVSDNSKTMYIADYVGDVVRIEGYWYQKTNKLTKQPFTSANFVTFTSVSQATKDGKNTWDLVVATDNNGANYYGLPVVYYTKRTV